MFVLVQILVPISICVVLPVLIIWIYFRSVMNRDNKNAEIVIKAIESDSVVDADRLVAALGKQEKTPLQILQTRLLRGSIFTFVGLGAAVFAAIMAYNLPENHVQYPSLLVSFLSLAIGIAYLVVYFVTRKSVKGNNV